MNYATHLWRHKNVCVSKQNDRLSASYIAETNGGESQESGTVTVELDMVFPEKEYLQMVEEYVTFIFIAHTYLFQLILWIYLM